MTKYILHGGRNKLQSVDNKALFLEMVKTLPKNITVLCVLFARGKELWDKKFEEDKNIFSSTLEDNTINLVLANDDINTFTEQIKQADIIYLKGGHTSMLKKKLSEIPNLKNLFSQKIVVGFSAGAYVLSKYYYDNDLDTFETGLGILNIKTICHYEDELLDKLKQLKNFHEDIKTYALHEEEFIVIEE